MASLHFLCHKSNTLQFPCTKIPPLVTTNTMTFPFRLPWFFLSLLRFKHCNLFSNKYTRLYFLLLCPPIPCIHTGIEDNPPERNIKGLESEAEECASRKQNRRNSSLTCRSVDGQQEIFPHDFTLSFLHFSSHLFNPYPSFFPWVPSCLSITPPSPSSYIFYFDLPLLFLSPLLFIPCYSPSSLNLSLSPPLSVAFFFHHFCFPSVFSLFCV